MVSASLADLDLDLIDFGCCDFEDLGCLADDGCGAERVGM